MPLLLALGLLPILATSACSAADPAAGGAQATAPAAATADARPFTATEVSRFDQPWAMAFLPDGSLLVTEKRGKLQHLDPASGRKHEITGVPKVAYGGQGGFGLFQVALQLGDRPLLRPGRDKGQRGAQRQVIVQVLGE